MKIILILCLIALTFSCKKESDLATKSVKIVCHGKEAVYFDFLLKNKIYSEHYFPGGKEVAKHNITMFLPGKSDLELKIFGANDSATYIFEIYADGILFASKKGCGNFNIKNKIP